MSVDTYSICPCGSGKKIKFCKCKDSIHEIDRVIKMVDGGQLVPALDRLATVLREHPDAAWALAIRGRLLIDLREYETLIENADRFIRLQPSNPLALTQLAAGNLFRGDVDKATASMLEALTESGREVDSFVLNVASVLAYTLLQSGAFLTARVYATLAMVAEGYEGGTAAMNVLQELNRADTIPMLLKNVPNLIPRPADVTWGERYDEAAGLLRSNKIALAETKFESLQRVAASAPSVLSGLLMCAIWRGDLNAQSDILHKLSDCESLPREQQVRYRAMAILVRPDAEELSIETVSLLAEVEDTEQAEMALRAASHVVALPAEMASQLAAGDDEVAPRVAFQFLDREKPDTEHLPTVDAVPMGLAMVLIYGKQTDRSARIEVLDLKAADVDAVQASLQETVGNVTFERKPADPMAFLIGSLPQPAMIQYKSNPGDAESLMSDLSQKKLAEGIASLKLPLLGGRSLRESADDDSAIMQRDVLVEVVSAYDILVSKSDDLVNRLCEIGNVEARQPIVATDENVEDLANEDLNRVDASGLSEQSLMFLLQRAQQVHATLAIRRCGKLLLEKKESLDPSVALVSYMGLISAAASQKESLTLMDEALAYADQHEVSAPRLLMVNLELRLRAGDGEGFQKSLQTVTTRHSNDPEVMAQLQQILMRYGLIRPDGSPKQSRPAGGPPATAAPTDAGELWTPDSGAAASGSESGGGKLWVPGME